MSTANDAHSHEIATLIAIGYKAAMQVAHPTLLAENEALKREVEGLREALVLAAIPLEAMFMSGSVKLQTEEVQQAINKAIAEIRKAIAGRAAV